MSNYARNKAKSIIHTEGETLTDQSQARETDINVIVSRYGITNQMPGTGAQPIYGDFTQLPKDLREFIDLGRSIEDRRAELPPELREMPIEELLALTPEQLTDKLTPSPTPSPTNTDNNEGKPE